MNPLIENLLQAAKVSDLSGESAKSETVANADYTDILVQISQMVAYMDMMLLVICVLVFFGIGLLFGYLITRWMRGN